MDEDYADDSEYDEATDRRRGRRLAAVQRADRGRTGPAQADAGVGGKGVVANSTRR